MSKSLFALFKMFLITAQMNFRLGNSLLIEVPNEQKMSGKAMVLFDSLSVREDAVQYSIELAKRMDYSLVILVVLALDSDDVGYPDDFEVRVREALEGPMMSAEQAGISVEAEIRVGDPTSELMKFLAGLRSVDTIIWGGHLDVGTPRLNKAHWFTRMKDTLECPVVVPSRKS